MTRALVRYILYAAVASIYLLSAPHSLAQSSIVDTARAEELVRKGWEAYLQVDYDSSIISYRRAAEIFVAAKRWERYVHCLNIIGDCYSRVFHLDSMETCLLEALHVENRELDWNNLEHAETRSLFGVLYIYRERFEKAVEEITIGKKIRENKLGLESRYTAASYFLLGLAYFLQDDYDRALDPANEALRVYTLLADDDHFDLANTLMLVGAIYGRRSDIDIALRYFLKAYSAIIVDKREYSTLTIQCEDRLGWAYLEKGDYTNSIQHLKKALRLQSEFSLEENVNTISTCFNLGLAYGAVGDYDLAIDFMNKSMVLERKIRGVAHSNNAEIARELAGIFAAKEEFEEADRLIRESYTIRNMSSLGANPALGYMHLTLGDIYEKRGEYLLALDQFKEALTLRLSLKDSQDRSDLPLIYCLIGTSYAKLNDPIQALNYFYMALDHQSKSPVPNRPQLATTLMGLGDVYVSQKKLEKGLRYYQEAINTLVPESSDSSILSNPIPKDITYGRDVVKALTAKAAAFELRSSYQSRDLLSLQASLACYASADTIVCLLRKRLTAEGSKLFLEQQCHPLYQNAIRLSMRLFELTRKRCYKEVAFHFAESGRANILLDGLVDLDARLFGGIPDSLIEMEKMFRLDLTANETKLQKELEHKQKTDTSKIAGLQNKCFAIRNNIQELLAVFDKSYPRYYEMKYKIDSPEIDQIQQAVDDKTCVLEYSLDKDTIYIFVITHDEFDVLRTRTPIDLEQTATTFRRSIVKIEKEEFLKTSAALYDILIRPVEEKIVGKSRLIVIPDGLLHYLPFESFISDLPSRKTTTVDFSQLKYVVRSHEITYTYSASFYLNRLHQAIDVPTREPSFAGFAPVFGVSDSNGMLLAKNVSRLERDSSEIRSISLDGKKFNELKYSSQEISSIAGQFQKHGRQSATFLREEATEENFKTHVSKYSFVHIATHGYINEKHPQLSMLLFSQPKDSTATEDGVLYGGETYNLNMNAELLVLSSCESGIGRLIMGEGMLAMTRGFFYSGATNIIFSLWKVYDRQTSDLMREFYRHVLVGETFSSSLRKAKLSMIKDQETAFPSKWSGFILVGN